MARGRLNGGMSARGEGGSLSARDLGSLRNWMWERLLILICVVVNFLAGEIIIFILVVFLHKISNLINVSSNKEIQTYSSSLNGNNSRLYWNLRKANFLRNHSSSMV